MEGMIPSSGSGGPWWYQWEDGAAPEAAQLRYRLLGIDRWGQRVRLAESSVQPVLLVGIGGVDRELELQVRGPADQQAFIQSAASVAGPWETIGEIDLDAEGQGRMSLPATPWEAGRFFRVSLP